jgi:hypothetical protein
MNPLLDKIHSRGYWKVVIRPITFEEKRVQHKSALSHILRKTSVSIKGWSFPHVDDFREFDEGPDWIGQEIEWKPILEFWRFYQSGQFVYYSRMAEDWRYSSSQCLPHEGSSRNANLDMTEMVTRFTEIFEFAARLSFSEVGDTGTHLEIALANFRDYVIDTPSHLGGVYRKLQAHAPEMTYRKDLSSAELVTDKGDLALNAALEFFQCFKWDPGLELLRDIQEGILSRDQPLLLGRFISR